ncbi:MAG TPA: hypothetical protein VFX18_01275 [Candidatus Nitrosocosmicus sp.]|nr:hypothetical protein [Candidatus Nitrosocosmicus sp.]
MTVNRANEGFQIRTLYVKKYHDAAATIISNKIFEYHDRLNNLILF